MTHTRRTFLAAAAAASSTRTGWGSAPDIFQAAAAGDVPRATELVNAEPPLVRTRSGDGRTPLHYATAAGKPAMVQFLVLRGAELNAGPENPLLAAVDYPDADAALGMSQFLLMNAADANARRHDGKTALELATARGHREIIEMLIHRGAEGGAAGSPNIGSVERVHFARRYHHDRHGKPVTRVAADDLNGLPWTQVNLFTSFAHVDFGKVKQMLSDEPRLLSTRASWDELAIEAAAHTGHLEMADWLADRGAPVSTCTAVLLGADELVKADIAADLAVTRERGAHDIAILAYTIYAGERTGIAERLLRAGANVHALGLNLTALHLAASKGYVEMAALLLEHGADVNARARTGGRMVTPLSLAVKAKQERMEKLLRDHGAVTD